MISIAITVFYFLPSTFALISSFMRLLGKTDGYHNRLAVIPLNALVVWANTFLESSTYLYDFVWFLWWAALLWSVFGPSDRYIKSQIKSNVEDEKP